MWVIKKKIRNIVDRISRAGRFEGDVRNNRVSRRRGIRRGRLLEMHLFHVIGCPHLRKVFSQAQTITDEI